MVSVTVTNVGTLSPVTLNLRTPEALAQGNGSALKTALQYSQFTGFPDDPLQRPPDRCRILPLWRTSFLPPLRLALTPEALAQTPL